VGRTAGYLLTRLPDLEHIDQLVLAFVDFRDAVDVVDDRGDADGACGGGQVPAVPPPLAVTVMDSPGSSACHADRGRYAWWRGTSSRPRIPLRSPAWRRAVPGAFPDRAGELTSQPLDGELTTGLRNRRLCLHQKDFAGTGGVRGGQYAVHR
jgi:hypothetical protein